MSSVQQPTLVEHWDEAFSHLLEGFTHNQKILRLRREEALWLDLLDTPLSFAEYEQLPYEHFASLFQNILWAGPDGDHVFEYLRLIAQTMKKSFILAGQAKVISEEYEKGFELMTIPFDVQSQTVEKLFAEDTLSTKTSILANCLDKGGNQDLSSYLSGERRLFMREVVKSLSPSEQLWLGSKEDQIEFDVLAIGGRRLFPEESESESLASERVAQLSSVLPKLARWSPQNV